MARIILKYGNEISIINKCDENSVVANEIVFLGRTTDYIKLDKTRNELIFNFSKIPRKYEMGRLLPGGRNRPRGLSFIVDDDDLKL